MIPLTAYSQTEKAFKSINGIAEHYGFLPIEKVLPNYPFHVNRRVPALSAINHFSPFDAEIARIMYSYSEHPHEEPAPPALFYHRTLPTQKCDRIFFGLHVIGSPQSIGEALLMKTALTALDELGINERCIHINSLGDRDSANRFTKELTNYLRKNINDLPGYCRQSMKKDAMHAFSQLVDRGHTLCNSAPCTVEFLTEHSRQHFKEVLEYLDRTETPYELAPTLIGNKDYFSKTLFEIRSSTPTEGETILYARGGRYDDMGKRFFKKDIPAVSLILEYEKKGRLLKYATTQRPSKRKPKLYFIQLGNEAQVRSLEIMETLRKAHVPVHQSLGHAQLSAQLELANELAIPYAIIMGHKEALDGTVIVRNMDTRSQDILQIARLPEYLKKIL
jgi:histidyl-tRNA synthetase